MNKIATRIVISSNQSIYDKATRLISQNVNGDGFDCVIVPTNAVDFYANILVEKMQLGPYSDLFKQTDRQHNLKNQTL